MERLTYRCGINDEHISIFREIDEQEALQKLATYEDAEEQGRLVTFPCAVGDIVYNIIPSRNIISTLKIISIHISECSRLYGWKLIDGIYENLNGFEEMAIGKTVFLTREAAEAALNKKP